MPNTLTQAEANRLIEMLKKTVEKIIAFPQKRGSVSFDVVGEHRNDVFIISIERKGKNLEKCTYQGRTRKNNQVLMRLDIDPTGKHQNPGPDGKMIEGTHLHIYCAEYGMRYAIPFDIENKDLYALCFTFFQKFHIIEYPDISYQLQGFQSGI